MSDDGDEDTGVMVIMMVGIMITVMEMMINVMTVSSLPVLFCSANYPSSFSAHILRRVTGGLKPIPACIR